MLSGSHIGRSCDIRVMRMRIIDIRRTVVIVIAVLRIADAVLIAVRLTAVLLEVSATHRTEEARRVDVEFPLELHERLLCLRAEEARDGIRWEDRWVLRKRALQFLHIIALVAVLEVAIEYATSRREFR